MIVVPDTSILVPFIVSKRGYTAFIRRLWNAGTVRFAVSPSILAEIEHTLSYGHIQKRHGRTRYQVRKFIKQLNQRSLMTTEKVSVDVVAEDPDDNKFLACAVEAKADAVVSLDPHLLSLKSFQGIPIITPQQCVEQLKSKAGHAA